MSTAVPITKALIPDVRGLPRAFWLLFAAAHADDPAVIAHLSPPDRRATYQGVFNLSWSASAFAPALGAVVLERAGSLSLWSGCLAIGVLNALIIGRIGRDARLGQQ